LVSLLVFADSEGNIQAGDGNAFLIAELCIFNCRFMYFYYAENRTYPGKLTNQSPSLKRGVWLKQ
jgi:hypothetical protein